MANARRYALPDPLMGSSLIEVDLVLANQRIQVSVTEQDDVVEHLSPATAHKSLRDGIHVGGSHRDLDDLRPGALRYTVERGAELVVTVAQDETWSITVHGRISQLLCCPLLRGIPGGCNVDNSSRCKVDDEECVDLAEEDVVGLDKVARPDVLGMILQERRPGLSTFPAANPAHVLLDRTLADLDAELEQLSLDALGSPQTASAGHVANEVDGFLRQRRASSRPRSEPPEEAETGSVPAEKGVWLHDGNGLAPRGEQRGAQEEFEPVSYPEPGTLLASTKDVDLVTKHCVLDDQVTSGAAHVDSHAQDLAARGEWAQALPDPLGGVSNPTCDLREEK
jgi:hypothetical protein